MSAPEQQTANSSDFDGVLVYVVDDEPMIGDVVQIVLKMGRYRSRFFRHPELALQAVIQEEVKPALLLTDYVMSPINGMELIERCKLHCPQLKTILYSGNAGEDVLQSYGVRPDAFLRKPFLPRTLLALVHSTLNGSPTAPA